MIKNILLLFVLTTNIANSYSLNECRVIADELNKNYPYTVDNITTITSAYCFQDGKKIITAYKYNINMTAQDWNVIPYQQKNSMNNLIKNGLRNKLCSKPITVNYLKYSDMRYDYYLSTGEFLFQFLFTKNDCGL